jgi:hypothetical protein
MGGQKRNAGAEGADFADGDGVEKEARAVGGGGRERGRMAEAGVPVAAGLARPDGSGDDGGEGVGDVEEVHGADEWAGRDSNPEPFACKANALAS